MGRGIHTIDVSLIVAPVLHKMIRDTAEDAGISYEEGLVDEKKEAQQSDIIARAKEKARFKKARKFKKEAATETPYPNLPQEPGEAETAGIVPRGNNAGGME